MDKNAVTKVLSSKREATAYHASNKVGESILR
ncbi:MAG: hypothetical protein ACJAXE_002641 [Neolewinella sp.]|jgi:hypothetical protein